MVEYILGVLYGLRTVSTFAAFLAKHGGTSMHPADVGVHLSDGDQLVVLDLKEELEPVDRRGGCSADGTSNSSGQQQLCRKRSASKI